jgi:hypothetical protein
MALNPQSPQTASSDRRSSVPPFPLAGTYPVSEDAVCGDCGFNAIGMSGCAPELDDLGASDEADVLLYVRRTDEGFDVVSTKE